MHCQQARDQVTNCAELVLGIRSRSSFICRHSLLYIYIFLLCKDDGSWSAVAQLQDQLQHRLTPREEKGIQIMANQASDIAGSPISGAVSNTAHALQNWEGMATGRSTGRKPRVKREKIKH